MKPLMIKSATMSLYWQVAQQVNNGIVCTKTKQEPEDRLGPGNLLACACGQARDQGLKCSNSPL